MPRNKTVGLQLSTPTATLNATIHFDTMSHTGRQTHDSIVPIADHTVMAASSTIGYRMFTWNGGLCGTEKKKIDS